MWSSKTCNDSSKKQLCKELCDEVRKIPPGARINHILLHRLERLRKNIRQEIVNNNELGTTPLFIACRRGLAEVVDYLCLNCGADLEIKSLYEVQDDRTIHYVTPLWCAAVAGRENVVKILIGHGANINSISDTGSTSVRSACFMTNVIIVKYLVEQGADVLKPNFNGGTCLINSVQSVELCEFLLDHKADINAQDIKSKTALHYAIEEHRFETVKLLISRGANPYLRSRLNDDALQTACTKGAFQIFCYLLSVLKLTVDQIADGYELLGSTFLDDHHDIHEAIQQWKSAAITRQNANVPKTILPPIKAFGYVKEFQTMEELDNVLLDHDAIRFQSLLICQRVLGTTHEDTIFRLMFRGAAYADALQYQKCIQLWLYALELRIRKDTILYNEVFFTSHALVKLFLDIFEKHTLAEAEDIIRFEDAFCALRLVGDEIGPAMKLLSIKPEYRRQEVNFDRSLLILIHFIYFALKVSKTAEQREYLKSYIQFIVRENPRTIDKDMTLLHLSVIQNNILNTAATITIDSRRHRIFPNVEVTQLLMDAGVPVNAAAIDGSSAVFLACYKQNFRKKVVELLVAYGAHLDQATKGGDHAIKILGSYKRSPTDAITLPVAPLTCLAARTIRANSIQCRQGDLPVELEGFLKLH